MWIISKLNQDVIRFLTINDFQQQIWQHIARIANDLASSEMLLAFRTSY